MKIRDLKMCENVPKTHDQNYEVMKHISSV